MAIVRTADPFDMMINPQAVLSAIESSERLQHLSRRVYRPLDRPIIPRVAGGKNATDDAAIDASEDFADDQDE